MNFIILLYQNYSKIFWTEPIFISFCTFELGQNVSIYLNVFQSQPAIVEKGIRTFHDKSYFLNKAITTGVGWYRQVSVPIIILPYLLKLTSSFCISEIILLASLFCSSSTTSR